MKEENQTFQEHTKSSGMRNSRIANLGMPCFAYLQVIPLLFYFEELQSKFRANPVWERMGGEGNH